MKIMAVEPGSIAEELGLASGDELLEINGERIADDIDFRFYESDPALEVKVARDGEIVMYDIEKDEDERLGIVLEEMRILSCGNDCVFCFVDQNPQGLRSQLYFRDGDYRLSFMYGNYTTMTNAGPAILNRIIRQRLSPQYISVHVTDFQVRQKLMGLKKDDRILEKIALLHDNGIDMHTQIVLCPGLNDGAVLEKTVHDLFKFHKHIVSLAVVPVGLTDHRWGLTELRRVDREYARTLLATVAKWQATFRAKVGRAFVYPSDEFFIVAGQPIPPATFYDGFPQIENGVGIVRTFLREFRAQSRKFPKAISPKRRITLATATLPQGILREKIVPVLRKTRGLQVDLEVIPNVLYGQGVTVAGLLSGKCLYSSLDGRNLGDLLVLPPDILNADGLFLDDVTLPQLEGRLGVPILVFDGRWSDIFTKLKKIQRTR